MTKKQAVRKQATADPARDSEVDAFVKRAKQWREETARLRSIALDCGLGEALKWRQPCYTFRGHNVAIVQGFKERCALMFFKGALLKDPEGLLEAPGPSSRAARRMLFSSVEEVDAQERRIRGFIAQAIAIEEAGKKVEVERSAEPLPDELEAMFEQVPGLKQAFEGLTPGRQRGYLLHFTGAKQSATRRSRIEKCLPRILEGRGLRD